MPFVILCMIFQEKCFSYYILLTDQVSFFLSLPLEILGNMCIAILPPGCDVINIGIKLMYLIKSFFNMIKKSRQKYLTIINLNPLSVNPTEWSNTLKQFVAKLPTNCLSVSGHFVNLALKGLKSHWKSRKTLFSRSFIYCYLTKWKQHRIWKQTCVFFLLLSQHINSYCFTS